MTARKRWTKEEEEILVQAVKANPHNLEEAFRKVAKEIGRTQNAVHHKWYIKMKHNSRCFITISSEKQMINGKNYTNRNSSSPVDTIKTLWEKLKNLINHGKN